MRVQDFGEAYRYLVDALDQFESILEVDPANVQCLGNCGNTLLALGELKLRMAKEMEEQQPKSVDSLSQLQQESQQFLTLAGRRFKTLLEARPDDKRAYMNWGKALCMRAQMTDDPSLKMQLYDAAIVKYEQVSFISKRVPSGRGSRSFPLRPSSWMHRSSVE